MNLIVRTGRVLAEDHSPESAIPALERTLLELPPGVGACVRLYETQTTHLIGEFRQVPATEITLLSFRRRGSQRKLWVHDVLVTGGSRSRPARLVKKFEPRALVETSRRIQLDALEALPRLIAALAALGAGEPQASLPAPRRYLVPLEAARWARLKLLRMVGLLTGRAPVAASTRPQIHCSKPLQETHFQSRLVPSPQTPIIIPGRGPRDGQRTRHQGTEVAGSPPCAPLR